MSTQSTKMMPAFRETLAGTGIGLLVGLLVGLSISEVVGGVVAGLTALLAAFFGLKGEQKPGGAAEQSAPESGVAAWRIVGFGFVCSVAVLAGLVIRTHNLLSRTPTQLVQVWRAAGFPEKIARELVAYQELGVAPEGWKTSKEERIAARSASALFATQSASQCGELASGLFRDPAARVDAFRLSGGGWQAVGEAIRDLDRSKQEKLLDATWKLVCE